MHYFKKMSNLLQRLGLTDQEVLREGALRYMNLIIQGIDDQILRLQRLLEISPHNASFTAMITHLQQARQLAVNEKTAIERTTDPA